MNCKEMLLEELEQYSFNQLFVASQVYMNKFFGHIKEETFYKNLERLVDGGILYHFSKGIYCKVKHGRFGLVPPSEEGIVKNLISKQQGMYIGYYLYNQLGLTTQISKKIEVLHNHSFKQRNIGNIVAETIPLTFSEGCQQTIAVLEVLKNLGNIQDLSILHLQAYLKSFALNAYSDEDFEKVYTYRTYPKHVLYQLKQVLDYYQVPNQLHRYLSTLSKYKEAEVALYEVTFG